MIDLFTQAEKQRIEKAVFDAETRTSAEIVPCVTDVSGNHEIAVWRGAAIAAIAALAFALIILRLYTGWGMAWLHSPTGMALLMLGAGVLGATATASIPPLKRRMAGSSYLSVRVHQRAMQAFVEEEVFRTRNRSGILIFISLFEHRIEVLGDAGINAEVRAEDWAEIVEHLQQSIRQDRLADGLVEAIAMCGDMLEASGLAVEADVDDINELANRVRLVRYES